MLTDEVEVADAGPYKIARGAPSTADMATLRSMLEAANQPMVILGGGGWSAEACADIKAFVEANGLPVTTAFRNQDLIDNRPAQFVGDLGIGVNPPLGKRLKESDLIVAIGPRLGEATTGNYTLFDLPVPKQKNWCMYMPAPRSSAASTRRRCRSTAAWRSSRRPPRR